MNQWIIQNYRIPTPYTLKSRAPRGRVLEAVVVWHQPVLVPEVLKGGDELTVAQSGRAHLTINWRAADHHIMPITITTLTARDPLTVSSVREVDGESHNAVWEQPALVPEGWKGVYISLHRYRCMMGETSQSNDRLVWWVDSRSVWARTPHNEIESCKSPHYANHDHHINCKRPSDCVVREREVVGESHDVVWDQPVLVPEVWKGRAELTVARSRRAQLTTWCFADFVVGESRDEVWSHTTSTWLIWNCFCLGPCSRPMPRALWWS